MELAVAIAKALGREVVASSEHRVSGGSINQCSGFDTASGPIFVKYGGADCLPVFEAEAAGLAELARAKALRVPDVLSVSIEHETAFLVLEWIDLTPAQARSEQLLGERLALQHRVTRDRFGWDRDNTIGSTPQSNRPDTQWIEFFREQRLLPQLVMAKQNGAGSDVLDSGHRLCERLHVFFDTYRPVPSLLHGDLWGGNWGADTAGEPVLFDPAVYFGDREADVAMTRLFGGFGPAFYAAYRAAWPLEAGADVRATLYNLYHVLNHFNLFGSGYLRQAQGMIQRLLAETKH
jgi:protein-ribulosamine 3-kinase